MEGVVLMPRKPSVTPAEIAQARCALSLFTPERPMLVGPAIYRAMKAKPEIADLMDRVRVYPTLPTA
jgi:hypothetical protein